MTLAGLLPPLSDNGNSKSYSLSPIATRLTISAGRRRIYGQYPYRPTTINRYPRRHSRRRGSGGRYFSEELRRFSLWMVDLPKQVEPILRKDSPVHDGDIGSSCLVRPFFPVGLELIGSVASVKTLEDVKSDPHCLYIAMPVQVCLSLMMVHKS